MNSVISYTRKLQLKSLAEDTGNASIFMLSCLADEETENELSTSISSYSFLCAMMSLILSSFVFSLCPLIYNYCNLIRYSHSSIVSRCSCKQTVDISIYVGGLWRLWFLRWSFLISIFFIRTSELTQFFVSSCDWINQLVPLWHTSVERCITFNCSKCTVFQIIMN